MVIIRRLHPRVLDHYKTRLEFKFISSSLPVYLTRRSGVDQLALHLIQQGSFSASKIAETTRFLASLKHDLVNVTFASLQLMRLHRHNNRSHTEEQFQIVPLRLNHLVMSDTFIRDIQMATAANSQDYMDHWYVSHSFPNASCLP